MQVPAAKEVVSDITTTRNDCHKLASKKALALAGHFFTAFFLGADFAGA
jgi:hypothetical protein